MNEGSQVRELIQDIAGTKTRSSHFLSAEVVSVDGETITVKHGEMELSGVKLRTVINTNTNTIIINPAVGSVVLCADLSSGKMRDLTVIVYSEIDSITINGGANKGLVKVTDLVTKLNALEEKVNDLITKLQGVVVPLAPSGTYPFSPVFSSVSAITKTKVADIENPKIKH
jgi:hypothetical protein